MATTSLSNGEQSNLPSLLPDLDPPSPQHERRTSKREEIEAGQFEIKEASLPEIPPQMLQHGREVRRSVLEVPKKQQNSKDDGRSMCAACCLQ
jgi:hypothetical protein